MQLSLSTPVSRFLRPGQFPGIMMETTGGDEGGTGGTGGTGGDAGGGDDNPLDKPAGITQRELQALLDRRDANSYSKAEKKYKAELDKLQGRLKELEGKGEGDDKNNPNPGKGKAFSQEDVQRLLADKDTEHSSTLDGLTKKIASLMSTKRDGEVISAATTHKALNPKVVAKLVADYVQFDEEDNLVVVDDAGKVRIDGKGNNLTVAALVEEYLTANPYLKQGSGTSGGGSSTKNGTTNPNESKLSNAQRLANAFTRASKR